MQIIITRVEGDIDDCDKPETVDSFAAAKQVLFAWSLTAPTDGCYNKCDFEILFEGEMDQLTNYKGRYDLYHYSKEFPDLREHVLNMAVSGLEMLRADAARRKGNVYTVDQRLNMDLQFREILFAIPRLD